MRVLIWMIAGGDRVPGGHRVQLEQTRKHLEQLGVCADCSFAERPDLRGYDLVHGFGLNAPELRWCRSNGVPIALSPIYWSRSYTMGEDASKDVRRSWKLRGRAGLVLLRSALQGRHIAKCEAYVQRLQNARIAYEMADMLLPNSEQEAQTIVAELGITTPYSVVPNAVDVDNFKLPPQQTSRSHVLYAGRIDPHKNQLGLIQAMHNSSVPVVIVGPPHPDHPDYYRRCRKAADRSRNIQMMDGVTHEELPHLYEQAKAHILPSWFETTGLVSLEAALCGCNIVTTDRGYAREYFQDYAWYCNPADPASIRRAVEAAYAAPCQQELRTRILNNYTWGHAAAATRAAYERILLTS